MKSRRVLAILALAIPALICIWANDQFQTAEMLVAVEAPNYPTLSTEELATLPHDKLAILASSAITKYKEIDPLWRYIMANDERTARVLMATVVVLAIAVFFLLWARRPTASQGK